MHLLALHRIARSGDGLASELQRLLSAREAQSADTRIVQLRRFNPAIPDVAGGFPQQTLSGDDPRSRERQPQPRPRRPPG
ncbi:hypothetical protein [Mesorhizobium sp. CN2-181]|uniref:hypothetical protein n=1 Tax=Mesorhizobium yinganensis TaxID=3157707 RepID=UPI0032B735D8